MSASGAGTVKWQQVSEDLVPVNITCIQDQPECVFHITAYNSQVDKILDVRLVQPGESRQPPFILMKFNAGRNQTAIYLFYGLVRIVFFLAPGGGDYRRAVVGVRRQSIATRGVK